MDKDEIASDTSADEIRDDDSVGELELSKEDKDRLIKRLIDFSPDPNTNTSSYVQQDWQRDAANSYRRYKGHRSSARVDDWTTLDPRRKEGDIVDQRNDSRNQEDTSPKRSDFVEQYSASVVDRTNAVILKAIYDSNKIVEVIPSSMEQTEQARDASGLLNCILLDDECNRQGIEDFLKDGLLSPTAFAEVKVYQPEPIVEYYRRKSPTGVNEIAANPDIEIIEYTEDRIQPTERYPEGIRHDLKVERRRKKEIRIEFVPIEEMIVPPAAKTISQAEADGPLYVGRRRYIQSEQLLRLFPEKRKAIVDKLVELKLWPHGDSVSQNESGSPVSNERHDGATEDSTPGGGEGTGSITMYDEYIWFDVGNEGQFRLLNVVRMHDNVILHIGEVSDNPFAAWSCYKVPGSLIGVSIEHRVGQYNDMMTAIRRFFIYNLAFLIAPGFVVNKNAISQSDIDALTESAPGQVVPVDADDVRNVLANIPRDASNDIAATAQSILAQTGQYADASVGMSDLLNGSDGAPQARTASGIAISQSRGMVVFEQIARQYSNGLGQLCRTILRVINECSDDPISVRTEEGMRVINPGTIDPQMQPRISLPGALAIKSQKLQDLMTIVGFIEKFQGTPYFDLLFKIKNLHALTQEVFASLGHGYSDRFVSVLPENAEEILQQAKEAAAKDPKVEAMLEIAKGNLEAKMKETMQKGDLEKMKIDMGHLELSQEQEVEMKKIYTQLVVDLMKLHIENNNDQARTMAEMFIKMADLKMDLKIAEVQARAQIEGRKKESAGSGAKMGGKKV